MNTDCMKENLASSEAEDGRCQSALGVSVALESHGDPLQEDGARCTLHYSGLEKDHIFPAGVVVRGEPRGWVGWGGEHGSTVWPERIYWAERRDLQGCNVHWDTGLLMYNNILAGQNRTRGLAGFYSVFFFAHKLVEHQLLL